MDQRVDFCAQTGDFQQLSRHEGKDTEVESRSSNGIQGNSSIDYLLTPTQQTTRQITVHTQLTTG